MFTLPCRIQGVNTEPVTLVSVSGKDGLAITDSGSFTHVDFSSCDFQLVEKPIQDGSLSLPDGVTLGKFVRKLERQIVLNIIASSNSREEAATRLGCSVATMYRKLGKKKY